MPTKILSSLEEFKAISDPYRMQIIELLSEASEPMTVSEVAAKLGDVPAKTHYHMKKLEKAGIVSIVQTREVNGILAKYYRPTADSFQVDKTFGLLPGAERISAVQTSITSLVNTYRKEWLRRFGDKDQVFGSAYYTMVSLTEERALELSRRLEGLMKEFIGDDKKAQPNEKMYQLFVSFFGEKHSGEALDEGDDGQNGPKEQEDSPPPTE